MKKLFLLTIVFIFINGCTTKQNHVRYDNALPADMTNIIHIIQTDFTVVDNDGIEKQDTQKAISFHIGNGYLLTCAHCVVFKTIISHTPWGPLEIPIKTHSYTYTRNNSEISIIGTMGDVGLLYDNSLIGTPATVFGDSDNLRVGDKLFLVGNSRLSGINVKTGIISMTNVTEIIFSDIDGSKQTITITIPANHGDSGGPVFATLANNPVVIGMFYAFSTNQGYNYAFKSNYLQDCIEKIKRSKVR